MLFSVVMIIRIRQIIFSIILMYPGRFVEVRQSFHSLHGAIQFYHIIFQFATFAGATATIVDVGLSVIVHKYTRIDHRVHSLNISLYFKFFRRLVTGSYTDLPAIIPVCFAGMREVEIVGAVSVSTIRSPHKTSFFPSPRHLVGTQDFSMIRPVNHIISREYMIAVHQVTSTRRSNVMRSVHIQSAIFPYMR